MKIQSKEIYAKDLAQMYKMFKRIAFFQVNFAPFGLPRSTFLDTEKTLLPFFVAAQAPRVHRLWSYARDAVEAHGHV